MRRLEIPIKIKYTAPMYFVTENAVADFATINDKPKAANSLCTNMPVLINKVEYTHAFFILTNRLI